MPWFISDINNSPVVNYREKEILQILTQNGEGRKILDG